MAKSPVEQLLDLLVYAPLGLALSAREALPELVEKGRRQLTGQVTTARMMGQMAVNQGQREAERYISRATDRLAGLGFLPDGGRSRPAGAHQAATPRSGPPEPSEAPGQPPVPAGQLAIPGYDALSASQVVQRLAGLSSEELDAVRAYEEATRQRKTILARISQLQSRSP